MSNYRFRWWAAVLFRGRLFADRDFHADALQVLLDVMSGGDPEKRTALSDAIDGGEEIRFGYVETDPDGNWLADTFEDTGYDQQWRVDMYFGRHGRFAGSNRAPDNAWEPAEPGKPAKGKEPEPADCPILATITA